MGPLEIVLGIFIILFALIISVLVLFQSGKDKKLSGAISGGADSFYSKSKSGKKDVLLSKLTLASTVIFAVLVVFMYIVVC